VRRYGRNTGLEGKGGERYLLDEADCRLHGSLGGLLGGLFLDDRHALRGNVLLEGLGTVGESVGHSRQQEIESRHICTTHTPESVRECHGRR